MPGAEEHLFPAPFLGWFKKRSWSPRQHQIELLLLAKAGKSALLIAPTGAGKTLAGFLPSLIASSQKPKHRIGSGSATFTHSIFRR